MIRKATQSDIPAIVELGISFHEEIEFAWFSPVNVEDWEATVKNMVETGIVFVAEDEGDVVGIVCGGIYPCYFNYARKIGQELVMYIDSAHRHGSIGRKLIKAFEEEAKRLGAHVVVVGAKTKFAIDKISNVYARLGFNEMERTYAKEM